MTTATEVTDGATLSKFKPLRVWPAALMIGLAVVLRMLPGLIDDGPPMIWMLAAFGPALCSLLLLLWWPLASRATWKERLTGFFGLLAIFAALFACLHRTMWGPGVIMLALPMGMAGFGIAAILLRNVLTFKRTVVAILLAACGFGYSTLLRSDGMWGDYKLGLHWRWDKSPEDKLMAARAGRSSVGPGQPVVIDESLIKPEWPGFRGADRTATQRGVIFESDWETHPPEQLWKIAVGPGWSSFVVAGDLLFTQEQHGPEEAIVCYNAVTGSEVWIQHVEGRFEDPLGGPGPRATPTLADGGLFVVGASGFIMRLDPTSGNIVWQNDMSELAGRDNPPEWGYCSSPLVVDSLVIVHAGGENNKGILALDAETGDVKWSAASGMMSYSSPQLSTIGDETFVLMLTDNGIDLLDPQSGDLRLGYEWKHSGYRSLQPQVIDGDSILLPTGIGSGTRRIRIDNLEDRITAEELWTSRYLKPDFNDFVVFDRHAFGFDDAVFTCIDLDTGNRKWKRGRYGKGQAILLEDSGLILIASEKGEIVLVKADSTKHTELAKIPTLEGRTWNHPVVVGDKLYLRNSQEAAAFRLPVKTSLPGETEQHDPAADAEPG